MPLYDYECEQCGMIFEKILPIEQCDDGQFCPNPECESVASCRKLITNGHGGFMRPDSPWIRSLGEFMEAPINNVQDLRRFYADNPDIKPKEGHPAIPSYMGDIERPPSEKEYEEKSIKSGLEKLSKLRRIEI
uniref:Putative regulatory protein FmdB zinc ribbon domain-containing protein n=1 Tax=viral metagenome TaxID=1070528 RepID=A0A6M3L428_9ZZZZ